MLSSFQPIMGVNDTPYLLRPANPTFSHIRRLLELGSSLRNWVLWINVA
jgi:hypothetical protein